MAQAHITSIDTGSPVFIEDRTEDWGSLTNFAVYRDTLFDPIQPNAAELIELCIADPMDNDPKHTAKATFEGEEMEQCYG